MIILIFLVLSLDVAAEDILTFDEISKLKTKKVSKGKPKKKIKSSEGTNYKDELEKANMLLDGYRLIAKKQQNLPLILKDEVIGEGDYIGAKTMLAVMATNTPRKIYLSSLIGVDLPVNAKISCTVISKYKRVCGKCDRLIIDGDGFNIDADLMNKDGANCVVGRIVNSDDKYIAGIITTEMMKGVVAVSQSSIPTISGNIIQPTFENKVKQGVIAGADAGVDIIKEKFKTNEPIVVLLKNSDVVVQFNQKVSI